MKEKELEANFDINNIHSVELNLLDGQIEIILRSLELYGYNLEYMLNSTDSTDDTKQEKLALLKYTYEQVLVSQAEQVDSKSNNIDNGIIIPTNFNVMPCGTRCIKDIEAAAIYPNHVTGLAFPSKDL